MLPHFPSCSLSAWGGMPFHGTLTLEFNGISGSERHEDGWIVLTEVPAGAAPFRAVPCASAPPCPGPVPFHGEPGDASC